MRKIIISVVGVVVLILVFTNLNSSEDVVTEDVTKADFVSADGRAKLYTSAEAKIVISEKEASDVYFEDELVQSFVVGYELSPDGYEFSEPATFKIELAEPLEEIPVLFHETGTTSVLITDVTYVMEEGLVVAVEMPIEHFSSVYVLTRYGFSSAGKSIFDVDKVGIEDTLVGSSIIGSLEVVQYRDITTYGYGEKSGVESGAKVKEGTVSIIASLTPDPAHLSPAETIAAMPVQSFHGGQISVPVTGQFTCIKAGDTYVKAVVTIVYKADFFDKHRKGLPSIMGDIWQDSIVPVREAKSIFNIKIPFTCQEPKFVEEPQIDYSEAEKNNQIDYRPNNDLLDDSEVSNYVGVETSFAHVAPGEYSEVYAAVRGKPGQVFSVALLGSGWTDDDIKVAPRLTAVADENGVANFTWKIYQYDTFVLPVFNESGEQLLMSQLTVD